MKQYVVVISVIAKNEEDAKRIINSNIQKYLNKSEIYTLEEYNEFLTDD